MKSKDAELKEKSTDTIEAGRKLLAEKLMGWTTINTDFGFFFDKDGFAVLAIQEWKPDEDRLQAFQLIDGMARKGFWFSIKSPFRPDPLSRWHAGFTAHDKTGWNGRPDYSGSGETFEKAVFNAALWWAKCEPELPPYEQENRQQWESKNLSE